MTQKKDNTNDMDLGNLDDINLDDINLDDIDLGDDFAVGDSNIGEDDNIQKLKELVEKGYLTDFVVEKIEEEIRNYDKPLEQAIKDVISSLSLVDLGKEKESITEENRDEYINGILTYIDNGDLSILENIVSFENSKDSDNSDNKEDDLGDISLDLEENDNDSDVDGLDIDLENEEDSEEFGDIAVDLEEEENNKEESEKENFEIEENISDNEEENGLEIELDNQEDKEVQEDIGDIAVEEDELTEEELSKLTKAKLMEKLDELGISYDKKLKKAELISLILGNTNENIEGKEPMDKEEKENMEVEQEEGEGLEIDLDEEISEEDSESNEEEILDKEESEEEFGDVSVDLDGENEEEEGLDIDLDEEETIEESENEELTLETEEQTDEIEEENVEEGEGLEIDLDEEISEEDSESNEQEILDKEESEEEFGDVSVDLDEENEEEGLDIDLDNQEEQDDQESKEETMDLGKNDDVEGGEDDVEGLEIDLDNQEVQEEQEEKSGFDLDNFSEENPEEEAKEGEGFNLDDDLGTSKETNENQEDKKEDVAGVGLSLDELESKVESNNASDGLDIDKVDEKDTTSSEPTKKQPRIVPNPEAKKGGGVILGIIVLLIGSVFGFSYIYFSYPELLGLDQADEQVIDNNPNLETQDNTEENNQTGDNQNMQEENNQDAQEEIPTGGEMEEEGEEEVGNLEVNDEDTIGYNGGDEVDENMEDENIKKQVANLIKEYYGLLKEKINNTEDEEEITALKKKTALLKTILKRVIKIDENNLTEQDEKYLTKIKGILEKKIENLKNE